MLKTVSSVANALGALNYKGTWDAATNTPTLASGVGTQGDYYVVSVAGTTDLDGITNWGVGDWAAFNGSVWQRVEGGADGNFVNLDVTGTAIVENLGVNVSSITSGFRAEIYEPSNDGLNIQAGNAGAKKILSLGSAGTPDKIVFTAGGDIDMTAGGSILMKDGKGIDFSATAGTGTSELLDDYEEGVWTPLISQDGDGAVPFTSVTQSGAYTKVGNLVTVTCLYEYSGIGSVGNNFAYMGGLPFTAANNSIYGYGFSFFEQSAYDTKSYSVAALSNAAKAFFQYDNGGGTLYVGTPRMVGNTFPSAAKVRFTLTYIAV